MTFSCTGKGREEEAHAEGIVDITEGIDEGGVPAITKENQLGNTTRYNLKYIFFSKGNKFLSISKAPKTFYEMHFPQFSVISFDTLI